MARCTKEEALATRDRILDAAENVFHAQGVASTSLEDVAQAAAVTRGAIYWHFKNKADLFAAMCERVRLPMEAMVEASADQRSSDPLGQLRTACVFVLREVMQNPHSRKVFDILYHKCEFVDAADPILIRQQASFQRARGNIERIFRNAITRKQLPDDLDVHLAVIVFHASLSGLVNNWLFFPGSFDLADYAEQLVDTGIDAVRNARSLRKKKAPGKPGA